MMSSELADFNPDRWVWGTDRESPQFLHVMLRVKNIDASIKFYCEVLGMRPAGDRFDFPERRVSGVVLGYEGYSAGGCIELIQAWDLRPQGGDGSGTWHFALGVPDIDVVTEKLDAIGVEFTVRPAVLIQGGPKLAFFKDPDGYIVELIQTHR